MSRLVNPARNWHLTAVSLAKENAELRARLEEAEDTLRAIREGEVEALVVDGPAGPQIFTLQGVDAQSNQFRGEILAQISDAVIAFDNEQRVTYLNAAAERQYGITASEALGRTLSELWHPGWLFPPGQEALSETSFWRGENVHTRRNGETFHVEIAVIRMSDSAGNQVGRLATIRDITERKAVEFALAAEARRKDEFLAMLGHELRNPLAAIRHAVQITQESPGDAAASTWAGNVIDRQSTQLYRMVDDLLDVARINTGRIELRFEILDLATILARAVDAVSPHLEQKKHSLTVETDEGLMVEGDAARLEQVFVNLLTNAVKYTSERGRLSLTAHGQGDQAVVAVIDNGIGIAPDMLPHVFKLFTQATTSLDRAQGGLGIGLTVVKSIVEMHGGSTSVESGGSTGGSTFTVRLPLCHKAPAPLLLDGAHPPVADATAGSTRVLIVDDHRDGADALARLLQHRHYDVRVAHDGQQALELADSFRPAVFLLDLGLPGLDGYDLARILRASPLHASALFVAISGYAQESDFARSRAAGFDHHFAKPVKSSTLLAVISTTQ